MFCGFQPGEDTVEGLLAVNQQFNGVAARRGYAGEVEQGVIYRFGG